MIVKCRKLEIKNSWGEYQDIKVGNQYNAFLVRSTVEFDEIKNDHVHKSTFLIFNNKKEWREYPSELFEPLHNRS